MPLPVGALPETASAKLEDGVLEVEIESPEPELAQHRRIDVREGRSS